MSPRPIIKGKLSMPDKSDVLVAVAPITEKPGIDRAMRMAIQRVRHGKKGAAFAQQQAFDAAVAKLVHAIPVDAQVAEWFVNENLIPVVRRRWKKILLNPAIIAIALALAVLAGIFAYRVHQDRKSTRLNSSHSQISYAVFCLKKKKKTKKDVKKVHY